MWTLHNTSRTLCVGLFTTREDAARWASQMVVPLEPVELLLNEEHAEEIVSLGLLTEGLAQELTLN